MGRGVEVAGLIAWTLFSITPAGTTVDLMLALASGDPARIAWAAADALGGKFLDALGRAKRIYSRLRHRKFLRAVARGAEYERYVLDAMGLTKNTRRITYNGITAIPDAITANKVFQIKDVKRIYKTRQLEAIAEWAKNNGKQPVLIVSQNNEYIAQTVYDLGFKVSRF